MIWLTIMHKVQFYRETLGIQAGKSIHMDGASRSVNMEGKGQTKKDQLWLRVHLGTPAIYSSSRKCH